MPALMAIIGGDATPLKRELDQVQRMARQSGASLQTALGGGGHVGSSGIIREALVLTREMSAGNWTKVPGSLSILLQRMGILKLILKDSASAANVLADAWQQEAQRASLAAVASTRKAAASTAALYAEGGETEATLAAAVADEEKAAADIVAARTAQTKATASAEAAAAANAEAGAAKASIGPLGIVAGILAGIGAGAYVAHKQVSSLIEKLSGVAASTGLHAEYIPKHLQKVNSVAEAQKEINREIERSVDLYKSAAKAAERGSEVTKSHFEHLRKMSEYQEERDLAKAKSEKEKEAVRTRYANERLRIGEEERRAELSNKYIEQANLEAESAAKKKQADAMQVSSKEHDAEVVRQAKERLDTLRKAEEEIDKSKNDPGYLGLANNRDLFRAYNEVQGDPTQNPAGEALRMISGGQKVSNSDLDAAEDKVRTDRVEAEKKYRDQVDRMASNDELRKRRGDLYKDAGEAASKAAVASLQAADLKKTSGQKAKDAAEEEQAKLEAEKAQHSHQKNVHGHLTSLQQIGAFAPNAALLDVNKGIHHEIKGLRGDIKGAMGNRGHDFGKTAF